MGIFDKLKGKSAKDLVDAKTKEANEKKEVKTENVKSDGGTATPSVNSVTDGNHSNTSVTNKVKFLSQFTKDVGDVDGDGDHDQNDEMIACCKASKLMMERAGFKTVSAAGRIDAGVFAPGNVLRPATTLKEAIALLDKNCDNNMPTLIGINRGPKSVGNANKATSHFVVIVSRTFNDATKQNEYRFYDPGTSYENKGTAAGNVFKFNMEGMLEGITDYSKKKYTITEVRPTGK